MAWDFSTDSEFGDKLVWARGFVRDEIYPLEVLDLDHTRFRRIAAPLQEKVKAKGLWAHLVTVARRLLKGYQARIPPTEHILTRRVAALAAFQERFDAEAVQ